jgi:glycosyltransferase involved in cell wall biosynthesis
MDTQSNLSIIIPNHHEKEVEWVYCFCRYFFPYAEIIIENDPDGRGKGYTIRRGFQKSTKDWIIFIDGDMDIHPRDIKTLLDEKKDSDIVIGKKSFESMRNNRKIISGFSRLIIKTLFNIPVSDTQTGIKLFNRNALKEWKTDGFLFDVEILHNAHKQGFKIKEVQVFAKSSKNKSLKDLGKTLCELITLWFRLSYLRIRGEI